MNRARSAHIATVAYVFCLIVAGSCSDDSGDPKVQIKLATITTSALSETTETGAKSGGSVTGSGGGTISARGVVWGTASGPTVALSTKTSEGTGLGDFTSIVSELATGTTYYIRAYATNEAGTAYGDEISYTPLVIFTDLDNALKADMATFQIPALSIAIIRNEKLVYVKSYGYSDKEKSVPAANSDRYRVATISQTITQAMILKLVSEGSLTLEQKVFGPGSILGNDYGAPPAGSKKDLITVRHLLVYISGWDNSAGDPMLQNPTWSQSDIIRDLLANRPLADAPGTTYRDVNLQYMILGRVIEKITKKSYEEYVKTVLADMGITDMQIAGNTLNDRLPAEVKYYQNEADAYSMNVKRMDATSGWLASTTDLARFITRVDHKPVIADLVPGTFLDETYFGFTTWYFPGSMYGSSAILERAGGSISYIVLANTSSYPKPPSMLDALNSTMDKYAYGRTDYPEYDLFDN